MIFDPALIQRGARLKRSPYFQATQRAGCRGYTVYNHMPLPIRYDSFEAETRAARRRHAMGRVGRVATSRSPPARTARNLPSS